MIQAIIFDMDGLLVDSEPYWDEARSIMAAEAGVKWSEEDHKAVMGVSTPEWVNYMIERLGLRLPPKSVEERIIGTMADLYNQRIPFMPGAIEAVALAAKHFTTALASGSPRSLIETVTDSPTLKGKFDVILSGDQFSRGKPAPDIYLGAAKQLNLKPSQCVCLEDSGSGILAGHSAGMKVIAVPDSRFPPAAEHLARASIVLNSLRQFSTHTFVHDTPSTI